VPPRTEKDRGGGNAETRCEVRINRNRPGSCEPKFAYNLLYAIAGKSEKELIFCRKEAVIWER